MKISLKHDKRSPKNNKGFTPTPISRDGCEIMNQRNSSNFHGNRYIPKKIGVSLRSKRGFTLVELLVVFFIMASILAVIVPGYFEYSTKLDLDNLALDVALTVREAQGYGAGSKVSSTGVFDTPYGIHFDIRDNPTRFIFFENTDNSDNVYTPSDGPPDDTIINTYTMKSGYSINDLCGLKSGLGKECGNGLVRYLDIIFKRPNPNAIITLRNSITGGAIHGGEQDSAQIELISSDQATTSVKINLLGAISIVDN